MHDNCFVDTNLLVYSVTDCDKSKTARLLFANQNLPRVSVQVINEFINVCKRKKILPEPTLYSLAKELIVQLNPACIDRQTLFLVIEVAHRYQYCTFDSLIIASALQQNCKTLFSEDMQHGQLINDKLTIINPFLTT